MVRAHAREWNDLTTGTFERHGQIRFAARLQERVVRLHLGRFEFDIRTGMNQDIGPFEHIGQPRVILTQGILVDTDWQGFGELFGGGPVRTNHRDRFESGAGQLRRCKPNRTRTQNDSVSPERLKSGILERVQKRILERAGSLNDPTWCDRVDHAVTFGRLRLPPNQFERLCLRWTSEDRAQKPERLETSQHRTQVRLGWNLQRQETLFEQVQFLDGFNGGKADKCDGFEDVGVHGLDLG